MMNIEIRRDHLLYDIANYAYIEGHRAESLSGEPRAAHLLTDICADGNIDRIHRVLAVAHATALEILQPLTCRRPAGHRIANEIWTPDVYRLHLRSDVRLTDDTARLIARLVHEYMVCKAVHDWMTITDPTAAARWAEKCAEAANALRTSRFPLHRRVSSPW